MKLLKKGALLLLGCGICCVLCILLFFLLMLITNKEETAYAKNSGWNCSSETFIEEYIPRYQEKLDELIQTHEIECMQRIERPTDKGDTFTRIYLYNEHFTVCVICAGNSSYGSYWIQLYYYGTSEEQQSYEVMQPCVQLINDFTRYVAYDTRVEECDNHFQRLYDECISEGVKVKSYNYHFDDLVGQVGYGVNMNKEAGYYYKAAADSNAEERLCVYFSFEGILKPLPTDGE